MMIKEPLATLLVCILPMSIIYVVFAELTIRDRDDTIQIVKQENIALNKQNVRLKQVNQFYRDMLPKDLCVIEGNPND